MSTTLINPRFRTFTKVSAPSWLTSGDGELVNYALDLLRDCFVQRTRLGLLARFPNFAPPDALAAIGRDRRIVRGINEIDASYVSRLIAWLDDRKTAGNPFALMKKLGEYTGAGCRLRTVDVRGNWFTQDYDGTRSFLIAQNNWDWDGEVAPRWSRFWVIIYPASTLWQQTSNWGSTSGPWGSAQNPTWGSTATDEQVRTIRNLVVDWKPAGTRCQNIVIAFDPASFSPTAPRDSTGMPDGLWTHWSKYVAGVQVPARLSTALYWDGTS